MPLGVLHVHNTASKPTPPRPPHRSPQQRPRPPLFTTPFPSDPHIAIIGGGIAGLACALELSALGIRNTVFDTGEHGVGGRAATRSTADGSLMTGGGMAVPPGVHMAFDHAAQYISLKNNDVSKYMQQCIQDNVLVPWHADIATLDAAQHTFISTRRHGDDNKQHLVCPGGMRGLASYMAAMAIDTGLTTVQRPMWVSDMKVTHDSTAWQLSAKGRPRGDYDAVVIAHNGKCANRLVQRAGCISKVLGQLKRLKLSASWVLMVAFAEELVIEGHAVLGGDGHAVGAKVRGGDDTKANAQGTHSNNATAGLQQPPHGMNIVHSDTLAWAACNNSKLTSLQHTASTPQCWTLISTAAYGKANKVPQEAVPKEVAVQVTQDMLGAWKEALGVESLPTVAFSRVQLWGAALPLNSPKVPCIWDGIGRVGVCGDWVIGKGAVPAAMASGEALARQIAAQRGVGVDEADGFSVGLQARFSDLQG